ncbi:MAG: hypothetical protein ACE1Y2_01415, partial [Stenotrophomonas maltophilia]
KRRRQLRGPSGVPGAGSGTALAEQEEAAEGANPVAGVTSPAARVRQPAAPAAITAMSSNAPIPARLRGDRPAAANYVKAEVVRILIMAGTLTAVLILISFFL